MKIFALDKFRRRNPKGYFTELPLNARYRAQHWLHRFVSRWGNDLPNWRFAILVGQAKRLALNPPAKRGGLAAQQKYRLEGRHPTKRATRARLAKQQMKKAAQRFEESGMPRVWHLPLDCTTVSGSHA